MKTKFKPGDIVEIIDIGRKDIFYNADGIIGIRVKLNNYIDKFTIATNLKSGDFSQSQYTEEPDHISLKDNYRVYYDVIVKKVRTLTPKTKKK